MEGRSSIKSGMYNSLDSCYLFETYDRQLYNELSILLSVLYLMPSLIGVILPKSTSQSSRRKSRNLFSCNDSHVSLFCQCILPHTAAI